MKRGFNGQQTINHLVDKWELKWAGGNWFSYKDEPLSIFEPEEVITSHRCA